MKTTTVFKTATLGDGNVGDTVKWYGEGWMGMKGEIVGHNALMNAWVVRVGNDTVSVYPGRCIEIAGRPFTPVSK